MAIDPERLRHCLAVLEEARSLPASDPLLLQLERATAHLRKSAKKKRKNDRKRDSHQRDRDLISQSTLAGGPGTELSEKRELRNQRLCYVCRDFYRHVHRHFHTMCVACGDACLARRDEHCDLRGRRALVTGGRTKIGYAVALRLLRNGAEVSVTTRFAKDAADRYLREPDVAQWQDRLTIVAADFRRIPAFLRQVQAWKDGPAIDILINNAAQTVWHPPDYYRGLWAREQEEFVGPSWLGRGLLPPPPALENSEQAEALFPLGQLDTFGDPIDLRRENSWVQHLGEIAPVEMVEVQMVNSIAPFVLCNELLSNMASSIHTDRFIVNVTAVEGQFDREKSTRHPHTNMAKAALNMLTRTSASDCLKDNIYMVAVDPGWMSHEGPHVDTSKNFHTPLEAVDSAARVCHPIVSGLSGSPMSGILLKDFRQVPW